MGRIRSAIAVLFAGGAAACSFLVSFDPEGQPCDEGRCLEGYSCVDGKCKKGGGSDVCGGCPSGERCDESAGRCVSNDCASRLCEVGRRCTVASGVATCELIKSPELGHRCLNDVDCGAGRYCYRGAIQDGSSGGLRTGVCVEKCQTDGSCATAGATCLTFSIGLDAGATRLCMPEGVLLPCGNDSACQVGGNGLVCTVFDHPSVGPASLCDLPITGAGLGESCSLTPGSTVGRLCSNGLCIPRTPSGKQVPVCGELCDVQGGLSTCSNAGRCELVEFFIQGMIRQLPMCVSGATVCASCADALGQPKAESCGPDAPRCTQLQSGWRCLSACSTGATGYPTCPPGFVCQLVSEGPRCLPADGGC